MAEQKPYVEVRRKDKTTGFNVCLCDRYITDNVNDTCYFLSLFGREEDVKINAACFLERVPLLTIQGRVELGAGKGYHFKVIQRKTGNVLHKVIFNADAFNVTSKTQVIMGAGDDDLLASLMKSLCRTVPTPLTPRWSRLIFAWLKKDIGCLQWLTMMGFPGKVAYELTIPDNKKVWDFVSGTILKDPSCRSQLIAEIKADNIKACSMS